MRRLTRGTPRQRAAARDRDALPDGIEGTGIGGTVTGGPMPKINLTEILDRGSPGNSRGGAVSGAAHVVVSSVLAGNGQQNGVALSDGSRISFASLADPGVLRHEDNRDLRHDKFRHLEDA